MSYCEPCGGNHDWSGFTHADWSDSCGCGCRCPVGRPTCADDEHDGPIEVCSFNGKHTTYECRSCKMRGDYWKF